MGVRFPGARRFAASIGLVCILAATGGVAEPVAAVGAGGGGLLPAATLHPSAVGPTVTAVVAGYYHTCALLGSGEVACWGWDASGQLGTGSVSGAIQKAPALVAGITATAIASGRWHNCAALTSGGVSCWGFNSNGQLGDGTKVDSGTPVPVAGISGASAVAAGGWHSCAIVAGGTVECWGYNSAGQLGDGTVTERPAPVQVTGISTAIAIAAGDSHTCALLTGGTVKCWGYNSAGQLGDGSTDWGYSTVPVVVTGISTATAITAGGNHTCALLGSGGVACWGWNSRGELGNADTAKTSVPVAVHDISTATVVTTGDQHSCAVVGSGGVDCWGYNPFGELGDDSTTESHVPVAVADIDDATALAAGWRHTCALLDGGDVACWGYNNLGQLGDGTQADRHVPVAVAWPIPGAPGAPTGVTAEATNGSATVGWVAPADQGDSPITGYTVTSKPGNLTCAPAVLTDLTCSVTGLTNNTIYTFTVTATNATRTGPDSEPSPEVAPTTGSMTVKGFAASSVGTSTTSPIPVVLGWTTGLDGAGVEAYDLQRSPDGLAWSPASPSSTTARSVTVMQPPSARYFYRVRALVDDGEATGAWITGPGVRLLPRQDGTSTVKLTGTGWTRTTAGSPYGGSLRYATRSGRTAGTTFTGRGIAWVSTLARSRGKAEVWIDGKRAATISLYRSTGAARRIVWSKVFATSGAHRILVKVLGTKQSASSSTRVDVDAFIVMTP